MNKITIIIRILFAVTLFQHSGYIVVILPVLAFYFYSAYILYLVYYTRTLYWSTVEVNSGLREFLTQATATKFRLEYQISRPWDLTHESFAINVRDILQPSGVLDSKQNVTQFLLRARSPDCGICCRVSSVINGRVRLRPSSL
jgi:hypothetical protein